MHSPSLFEKPAKKSLYLHKMFAEDSKDDENQAQFQDFGLFTEIEIEEANKAIEDFIEGIGSPRIKPQRNPKDRLSVTEKVEIAEDYAFHETHRTYLDVTSVGHVILEVGYPTEANLAQHETHLELQHSHDLVLIDTHIVKNDKGYHDYHVAQYMHRDDYDNAVLEGFINLYR